MEMKQNWCWQNMHLKSQKVRNKQKSSNLKKLCYKRRKSSSECSIQIKSTPVSFSWTHTVKTCEQPLCKHFYIHSPLCLAFLMLLLWKTTEAPQTSGGSEHILTSEKAYLALISIIPSTLCPLNFLWAPFPLSNSHNKKADGFSLGRQCSCGCVYTALREGNWAGAWRCKYNRNPPLRGLKARMISF